MNNILSDILEQKPLNINAKTFSAMSKSFNVWANFDLSASVDGEDILLQSILDNAYTEWKKSLPLLRDYYHATLIDYFVNVKHQLVFSAPVEMKIEEGQKGPIRIYKIGNKTFVLDPANLTEFKNSLYGIGKFTRIMTLREREKLLGFPEDYTSLEVNNSSFERNRVLADSVPVKIAEWIINNLIGGIDATDEP